MNRATKYFVGPLVVFLLVTGTTGAIHERWARSRAIAEFPPPGQMVEVDGHKLHLDCRGEGTPTVVLEAGMDPYGSIGWSRVHDALAAETRVCAYDRAGIAWSDPLPSPRDGRKIVEELHQLVEAAGIDRPFILAGHSMGGAYALVYANRYPDDLAGLALIESSHPDQFERLPAMGQIPPKIVMQVMPFLRSVGLMRWLMRSELRVKSLSDSDRLALQAVSASSMSTVAQEFQHIRESLDMARQVSTLGGMPLLVMSVGNAPDASRVPGFSQQQVDKAFAGWTELQMELSSLSADSRHIPVQQGTHYLQFSQPQAVIDAVSHFTTHCRSIITTRLRSN